MELQVFVRCADVTLPVGVSADGKVSDIISQLGEGWTRVVTEDGEDLEDNTDLCDTSVMADDILVAVEGAKFYWNTDEEEFYECTGLPKGIINYNCFKVHNTTLEKSSMQNKTFCFSAMPGIPEGTFSETFKVLLSGTKTGNSRQQLFNGVGVLSNFDCGFLSVEGVRYRPCDGAILSKRNIVANLPPATESTVVVIAINRTLGSTFVTFTVHDHSFTIPWSVEGTLYPTVQVEQVGAKFTIIQ